MLINRSGGRPKDFALFVAGGKFGDEILSVRKFGHNEAVTDSFSDLWDGGGDYPFPTTANPVRIAAGGNAADTAAGLGARSILIQGLDENWNPASEELATNGALASADTVTSFIRVFRVYVKDSGAYGAANTGTISIETNPGGVELARIPASHGQTQMAIYTIPAGYKGFLNSYDITADKTGSATFDVRIWRREDADVTIAPTTSPRMVVEVHGISDRDSRVFHTFPEMLPPKTDIWIDAKASAGTNQIAAEFDLWLTKV